MISWVSSSSSSGTQIKAFRSPRVSRCRSTQLTHAFSLPPTHHFQNGGCDVSRTVSHFLSQVSISAYSTKHSGKRSSEKRSRIARSFAFASARSAGGGWMYSSSRQCTAISASETWTSSTTPNVLTSS